MRQKLADYRLFWREFRQTYHDTGAIMPSGNRLARSLARYVQSGDNQIDPRRILEVGSGTGAVTREILMAMGSADHLTLVELNGRFANRLRERLEVDPLWMAAAEQIVVVQASVEDLPESDPFDVIISGLPLNNFSIDLVERLVAKMLRLLSPNGTLSFFEYVAIRRAKAACSGEQERTRLRAIGAFLEKLLSDREFHRDQVWANVPPAWVHHLR